MNHNVIGVLFMSLNLMQPKNTQTAGPRVLPVRPLSAPGIQNTRSLYNSQGKRPSSAPTPRSQAGSIPSAGTGDAATKTGPRVLNVTPFIVPPTPQKSPPKPRPMIHWPI